MTGSNGAIKARDAQIGLCRGNQGKAGFCWRNKDPAGLRGGGRGQIELTRGGILPTVR